MTPHEDPFAHWPDRTILADDQGQPLLIYTASESTRNGRPWADGSWKPPSAAVEDTVQAMLVGLAGYSVSTSDPELVGALEAAGAKRQRHAHVMSHPLGAVPATTLPAALRIEPLSAQQLSRQAEPLAEISLRAYPSGHPDHDTDDVAVASEELRAIARGEVLGPYLGESRVAVAGGRLLGACLLVDREGAAPNGGPWIVDVFRDPDTDIGGVGTALLVAAVSAAKSAGLPALSLAVSHSNTNALARYSALGFVDAEESWTVAMP